MLAHRPAADIAEDQVNDPGCGGGEAQDARSCSRFPRPLVDTAVFAA